MNSQRLSCSQVSTSGSKLAASMSHQPMPTIPTRCIGRPLLGYSLGATSQEASAVMMETPRSRTREMNGWRLVAGAARRPKAYRRSSISWK